MKRLAVVFLMLFSLSVFADNICPAGYQPAEYTELEYIENEGRQYIDTGYAWTTQNTEMAFDIMPTSPDIKGAYIGSSSASRDANWYVLFKGSGKPYFAIGSGNMFTTQVSPQAFVKNSIKITTNENGAATLTLDGTQYNASYTGTFKNEGHVFLYAMSYAQTSIWLTSGGLRFYRVQLKDNYKLVRDFVPVKRLSDNAIGMFNRVESKFYGNDGTGEFIAGPEVLGSSVYVECMPCPPNTYKDFVGNRECTPCPTGTFSPIGSISLEQCARILNIGDSIIYMPLNKHTQIGLCTLYEGKTYCADMYEKQ